MTSIINYGISETLKALFAQLKETPGLNGYKYHHKDVELLSRNIVCRNYGSVCYELSFLCWAVVNHPQYSSSPLLSFFWLQENIQPKRFREAFAEPLHTTLGKASMGKEYLTLQLGDIEFSISPTRVAVLAVMLELIASIDPAQLGNIEKNLLDANAQTVKKVSSELQKLIYAYLKQHLPEASTQERFRAISSWLKQHGLSTKNISDQDVLDFWLHPPEQPSYIKFSTVLDDLLDAISAMEVVENAFNAEHGLSLINDSNGEPGEIPADWVQNTVFEQTQSDTDLSWLCQSPKFLTLAQYQAMSAILSHSKLARQLPLSFLRLKIFSGWQSVLVQAKRKSPQVLADKLSQCPEHDYQGFVEQLNDSETQCKQVQKAIGHIFYALKSPLFVGIMLKQIPLELQQILKIWMREKIQESDNFKGNMFTEIQQWLSQYGSTQTWLAEANKAFNLNNKDGFKTLPCSAELETYQDGSDALQQCQQIVAGYLLRLEKLNHKNTELEAIYRSDLCIFSSRFKQIYGASNA